MTRFFCFFALMTLQLYSLAELNDYLNTQSFSSFIVLTDSNTHQHCAADLLASCDFLNGAEIIEVEPGEASKDIEIVSGVWAAMLENGADRHACLINLGGGMITDLGGFIASTYKRGIASIHIPTSLLGMVDAAIGGKTGINLLGYKNQVGTFSAPHAIVTCAEWLQTLPERELRSGIAEMLKHGLIADPEHLNALTRIETPTTAALSPLIRRSAEIKKQVVERDFHESGIRQILNFGHTAGHAIESLTAQSNTPLLHGEAVARGISCALHLSVVKLGFDPAIATAVSETIKRLIPLPTGRMKEISPEALWPIMRSDKKNRDGAVLFVLLKSIGKPRYGEAVDFNTFAEAWQGTVD